MSHRLGFSHFLFSFTWITSLFFFYYIPSLKIFWSLNFMCPCNHVYVCLCLHLCVFTLLFFELLNLQGFFLSASFLKINSHFIFYGSVFNSISWSQIMCMPVTVWYFLPFFSDLCYEHHLLYMASSNPNNWKLLVLWVFFAPSNTTVSIFSFFLEATVNPHVYSMAMRFSSVFISGQFWYN